MKKIKLILNLLVIFLFANSLTAQQIKFADITDEADIKGQYTSYIAKDGHEYKIGDRVEFGPGSGNNGFFVTVTRIDIAGNVYPVGNNVMNTSAEIKKIRVVGNKRQGLKVQFQTKGATGIDNYFVFLEDAILVGEIKSKGMTSDQAMSELKKAKDKLDLGLITQEEYDKIKSDLIKYIK